ncbi:MAG: hypothetical protein H6739_27020 [Alphaproteobacteria bacterium]|nr:hypothetical protein [Alphaproteobacteria bacterium]
MAHVLVIGSGPLPVDSPDVLGFPQLRTEQTLRALLDGGHRVTAALLGDATVPLQQRELGDAALQVAVVQPESADWVDQLRALRASAAPDVVMSAGPYNPARAAAMVVEDEPLWVDVPGDPFAEAQARSAHFGEPDATPHMRAAYAAALARGDAFGAISGSQRAALLGQLGLVGRLTGALLEHPWVHEVPAALSFGGLTRAAPRTRDEDDELVVALCGGYNTWLDTDTLLTGLHRAMAQVPGLRVISTGGGIAGHHTSSYEAFRAQATTGPFPDRFTFHGWVPHDVLPGLLSRAHVGICLDRPGVEAELGTRTRVLFYAHMGLTVLATPRSDLTREMAAVRLLVPITPGDPDHLCSALVELAGGAIDSRQTTRAWRYLNSRYGVRQVYAPLVQWAAEPTRTRPAEDPSAELARELALARQELAAVHRSPTWRAAGAVEGMLRRIPPRLEKLLGWE